MRVVQYLRFYFYSLVQHHSSALALYQGCISNTGIPPTVISSVLHHESFVPVSSLLHLEHQDLARCPSYTENAQTLLLQMNLSHKSYHSSASAVPNK